MIAAAFWGAISTHLAFRDQLLRSFGENAVVCRATVNAFFFVHSGGTKVCLKGVFQLMCSEFGFSSGSMFAPSPFVAGTLDRHTRQDLALGERHVSHRRV